MNLELSSPIVAHLWQSTVFAGIVWLATLALRANGARVRYWLWTAASLKFFVPFAWLVGVGAAFQWQSAPPIVRPAASFVVERVLAPPTLATTRALDAVPAAPTFQVLPWVLALVWLAGSTAILIWWWRQWRLVHAAVRNAVPVAMSPCDTSGIVTVTSSLAAEPGVVGIRRPVLMLPEGLADRLTPNQLRALVVHEHCHIRCHDNLLALIHMLVEAVFWFHPVVWWIEYRMVDERERACDEAVLRSGNDPADYAEGLLEVCRSSMASSLPCVAGVKGSNLRRRVEYILRNQTGRPMTAARRIALALVAALCITMPVLSGVAVVDIPLIMVAEPVAASIDNDPIVVADPGSGAAAGSRAAPPSLAAAPTEATRRNSAQPQAFDVVSIETTDCNFPEEPPMNRLALAVFCSVTASVVAQQPVQQPAPQPPLRFEVASVKPNETAASVKPNETARNYSFTNAPGGAFRASLPLEWLIGMAYDIQPLERIVGEPSWARTQWFDIDAKPATEVTNDERKAMLRTLLEERFGLVWRKDPTAKDMVWALVMAREDKRLGPGIRVAQCEKVEGPIRPPSERQLRAGQPVPCGSATADRAFAGGGQPIRLLASTLQLATGEEIIDRTGLLGNFDFYITLPRNNQTASDAAGEPSVFTAIQEQLGMKLQREEIIRDAFVVVRVSQPTPN